MKEKWGILAGNTGFFKMDDVEVPEENVLGQAGRRLQDRDVRAGPGALHRGRRRDRADSRLPRRERQVREGAEDLRQSPIAEHQLVKEMIAQMESDYQAARLLWLRAGLLKNAGRRNTRETGLAKWFATVASERAAGDAVQVHGANGYSDEYPVGRFYRNCKGAVIYEGTREIHKVMQADYVLGFRQDKPTRCELPPYKEPVDSSQFWPFETPDGFRPLARIPRRRRAGGDRLRPHDGPGRRPQVGSGGGRGDAADAGCACRSTARS